MDQDEIKQVPLNDLKAEEGADDLIESAAMQPYVRLAVALLEGKSIKDSVAAIAALPLEQRELSASLHESCWT